MTVAGAHMGCVHTQNAIGKNGIGWRSRRSGDSGTDGSKTVLSEGPRQELQLARRSSKRAVKSRALRGKHVHLLGRGGEARG